MALPNYKDIIELIKAGATLEAQEKIMDLRQTALDCREENVQLRSLIQNLEARVRELEAQDGEPCPKCRKRTWVVESSTPDDIFGPLGEVRRNYKCESCGFSESKLVTP